MENKQVLSVSRVLKTSSKGNQYEVLVVRLSVNGKIYEIAQTFLDDTKIALLDLAQVDYEKN